MPDPVMPTKVLYMTIGEEKTFGVDFQDEGAVIGGETIDTPTFTVSGGGASVIAIAINAAEFFDSGQGRRSIPVGNGVQVKLHPLIAGQWDVVCRVFARPSNDELEILGRLIITATVPP